jgi:hypothetical protein
MVDRLILHIGATKTGTSAIQSALARNRATLLANGILYPVNKEVDDKAKAGRVTGGNGALFRSLYNKYPDSPQRALRKFEADLRHLASDDKANALLFSHERGGGVEPELLSELKAIFSRYFDRVQVIYYVRHLTDHAISQYGEYVKRRGMKAAFNAFAPKYRARFKRTIETYESVFGRDDIEYVLYDDVRRKLFRDFLQRVGLPSSIDYQEPERVNRSLTADEIEVLRHVNHMGLARTLVARIVENFTFENKNPKQRPMPISRADIETIEASNRDVLECVNVRLSGGAVLRAASDGIMRDASDMEQSATPGLDPQIMAGLLASGLRVTERRNGKLDPHIVGAVRQAEAGLRDVEQRQDTTNPKLMLSLLEAGLRAINSRHAEPTKPVREGKMRKRDILKAAESGETDPKAADLLAQKRQRRIERKKQKASGKEVSESPEQKRQRRIERKKQKASGAGVSESPKQRRQRRIERKKEKASGVEASESLERRKREAAGPDASELRERRRQRRLARKQPAGAEQKSGTGE